MQLLLTSSSRYYNYHRRIFLYITILRIINISLSIIYYNRSTYTCNYYRMFIFKKLNHYITANYDSLLTSYYFRDLINNRLRSR